MRLKRRTGFARCPVSSLCSSRGVTTEPRAHRGNATLVMASRLPRRSSAQCRVARSATYPRTRRLPWRQTRTGVAPANRERRRSSVDEAVRANGERRRSSAGESRRRRCRHRHPRTVQSEISHFPAPHDKRERGGKSAYAYAYTPRDSLRVASFRRVIDVNLPDFSIDKREIQAAFRLNTRALWAWFIIRLTFYKRKYKIIPWTPVSAGSVKTERSHRMVFVSFLGEQSPDATDERNQELNIRNWERKQWIYCTFKHSFVYVEIDAPLQFFIFNSWFLVSLKISYACKYTLKKDS